MAPYVWECQFRSWRQRSNAYVHAQPQAVAWNEMLGMLEDAKDVADLNQMGYLVTVIVG